MTQDKYYTPDISEFYVGFEYVCKNKKYGDLNLCVIEPEDIEIISHELTKDIIRVKFLSKEDIEDLGFEEIGQECYYLNGNLDSWCLMPNDKNDKSSNIWWMEDGYCEKFSIEIKNKSELIKLMKQKGISI